MEEQRNEYRTGRTEPRPKRTGFIALLLILVIFLSGLVSVLGIMNIHLFRLLDERETAAPLSFSPQEAQDPTPGEGSMVFAGMTVEEISVVYQSVQELPSGLYISHVQNDSVADQAGIMAGDVLEAIDGTPITALADLQAFSQKNHCTVTVSRKGQHTDYTLEVNGQ